MTVYQYLFHACLPTMARLARLVVPGLPHHVTQRGSRRGTTVFEEGDHALYLDLMSYAAARARAEIRAYCLMPNHVHIILVPSDEDGLRRTFADLHRRHTGFVNARAGTTGHLWQGRYGSVAMDEGHLHHAVRYVSLNPVRARDWAWSSVRAHLAGSDDKFVRVAPVLERVGDFARLLDAPSTRTRPLRRAPARRDHRPPDRQRGLAESAGGANRTKPRAGASGAEAESKGD